MKHGGERFALVICMLFALQAAAFDQTVKATMPADGAEPSQTVVWSRASIAAALVTPEAPLVVNAAPAGKLDPAVNQPPVTPAPADLPSCTDRPAGRLGRGLVRLLAELARVAASR